MGPSVVSRVPVQPCLCSVGATAAMSSRHPPPVTHSALASTRSTSARSGRNRLGCEAIANSQTSKQSVQSPAWGGPDDTYSLHTNCVPATRAVIAEKYPDLIDLVDEGSLLVYNRPETYKERRTDGYREPEQIFVLGTSHVSERSARDTTRVIQAVQPDKVVVELCRSRTAQMYTDTLTDDEQERASDPMSLSGGSMVQSLQRSLALGGPASMFLRLAASSVMKRSTQSIGVKAGREFVAARQAAEELDVEVVLGDRPLEITLSRCWEALTWTRRLQVLAKLPGALKEEFPGGSGEKEIKALIEESKDSEKLAAAQALLARLCPEIIAPLIHERDLYLAWSMKRSKAANGTKRVVGIVGKGHLRGIMYAMENDPAAAIRFKDLVGGRNTREFKDKQRREALTTFVRDTAIFSALAWAWSVFHAQAP